MDKVSLSGPPPNPQPRRSPALTPEQRILDVLAEMIAYDKNLDLEGSGINMSEMPSHPGLD